MAPLGPQLPPGLQKRRRSEDDESESDSSTGPAPPPKPAHQQSPPASKRSRVIGPSLPPEPSNDPTPPTPPRPAAEEDSDSDDDDFGPSLPSASDGLQNTSISVSMGPQRPGPPDATAPLKRDEWMTLAPADGDWSSRVDPTKLKNRKFNTGRGAKAPPRAGTGGDNSSWHETPEQKQARLKREVMGVGDTSTTGKPSKQGREISAADEATARRLKEYKVSILACLILPYSRCTYSLHPLFHRFLMLSEFILRSKHRFPL